MIDGSDVKVSIVYQGDFDKKFNGWGWGCYCAEQLKESLSLTKTLADDKIHEFAGKWHKLCEENQNFRTVKEGELVSCFVDFRDGLTPIQRSILYAMEETGYEKKGPCKRTLRIIGETMGHYEHYGDYFVYGQIARMVQKFSFPYPLISGQGNFGTRRIPHADSYINTKIKLSKNGEKLLENVHSEKMPFVRQSVAKASQSPSISPVTSRMSSATETTISFPTNLKMSQKCSERMQKILTSL